MIVALGLAGALFPTEGHAETAGSFDVAWSSTLDTIITDSQDRLGTMVMDSQGNVIVLGTTHDNQDGPKLFAQKYAVTGALLWERRYPDLDLHDVHTAILDELGGLLVVVHAHSPSHNYPGFYHLLKLSATDGALLWQQSGARASAGYSEWRHPRLTVDRQGDIVMAATINASLPHEPCRLTKYRGADGVVLWQRQSEDKSEAPHALVCDADGHVLITTASSLFPTINADFTTAKYETTSGALLWERRYPAPAGGYSQPGAMALDPDGDVVVAGRLFKEDGGSQLYFAKYAPASGDIVWERLLDDSDGDYLPSEMAFDAAGNIVLGGENRSLASHHTGKYAATDGTTLWERSFPRDSWLSLVAGVVVDGAGDVTTSAFSNGSTHTVKYAGNDGAVLWERNGPAATSLPLISYALAVDPEGHVVVAGQGIKYFAEETGHALDFLTIKYATTDGATLWEQRYDGPAHAWEEPAAIAIDATGNVAVAGFTHGGATGKDLLVYKLAADTGQPLWQHRYNGAANARDEAVAVAVDAAGNVVVTGVTTRLPRQETEEGPVGGDTDIYTAKYAAADGTLLWERHYDGPARLDDAPVALVMDAAGNVVISGWSGRVRSENTSIPNPADYYTAKYAATDGTLLWERRYSRNGTGNHRAVALMMDGSQNVIVAGDSHGPGGNLDCYIVKYRAADGSPLWEQRLNTNSDDRTLDLALDAMGHVILLGLSGNGLYTIKYQGDTGVMLWEQHVSDRKISASITAALIVDPRGNVLISYGKDSEPPVTTRKYAATDGHLLWERPDQEEWELEVLDVVPDAMALVGTESYAMLGRSILTDHEARILSIHALADGRRLSMYGLGPLPLPEETSPAGRHLLAPDGNGNILIAGSVGSQSSFAHSDPRVLLLRPSAGAPAPLTLDSFARDGSSTLPWVSWTLTGKGMPHRLYALEFSYDLQGWSFYDWLPSDDQGNISYRDWSNVPHLHLRLTDAAE